MGELLPYASALAVGVGIVSLIVDLRRAKRLAVIAIGLTLVAQVALMAWGQANVYNMPEAFQGAGESFL
jgi:hypothetical protein